MMGGAAAQATLSATHRFPFDPLTCDTSLTGEAFTLTARAPLIRACSQGGGGSRGGWQGADRRGAFFEGLPLLWKARRGEGGDARDKVQA